MLLCHDEDTRFTARRFASRQDSNNPPALEIEYIVPARIDLVEQTGTQFNLSFVAQAGQTYSVEFRDSLVSGNWQSLTNIAAPPETMRVFVTNTISSAQRSYRVTTQ
jgi:hypothetical protein